MYIDGGREIAPSIVSRGEERHCVELFYNILNLIMFLLDQF